MKVLILPSALGDLQDGFDFYEEQVAGVGDHFFRCLFSDIDAIVHHAGVHRKIHGHHRAIARRFPYAIYYTIERDTILIRRVLDCRRNPRWIRKQLD
jgi:plasmid stabilization system protein ParE